MHLAGQGTNNRNDEWVWRVALDMDGWSALHCAADAGTYSVRAARAAEQLVPLTPADIINTKTTGSQPRGFTALHFACDGSDLGFCRVHLVGSLLEHRAELESQTLTQAQKVVELGEPNSSVMEMLGVGMFDEKGAYLDWNSYACN